MTLFFSGSSQSWILIELDHLLDNLVLRAIKVRIILELSRVVSTFFRGPLLLVVFQVSLELSVVFANDSFGRIIESISDIVCSLRYVFRTIDVITNQSFSIRSQTFQLFCVESAILYGAVVPVLVLKLQIVVEKVLSLDELSAIPFGNVSALLKQL